MLSTGGLVGHFLVVLPSLLSLDLLVVECSPRVPDDGADTDEGRKDAAGHGTLGSGGPSGGDGVRSQRLAGEVRGGKETDGVSGRGDVLGRTLLRHEAGQGLVGLHDVGGNNEGGGETRRKMPVTEKGVKATESVEALARKRVCGGV